MCGIGQKEDKTVMKKRMVWKILFVVGMCPFILPLVLGVYRMSIESWTMMDWLVIYSFIYWPTYVGGIILITVSLKKLLKQKENGSGMSKSK